MNNINSLVKLTIEVCKEYGLDNLSSVPFSHKIDSIWSIICLKFFHDNDIKNLTNIYSWWNCDYCGYATSVKEALLLQLENNENFFQITIKNVDWLNVLTTVAGLNSRKRFNRNFDKIVNQKLFEKNGETNCLLKTTYNGFKKKGSQKKDSNYWSGRFKCFNKNCSILKAYIRNEPKVSEDVIINFCLLKKKIIHSSLETKQKLRTLERKNLTLNAISEGSEMFRSNIILEGVEKNQSIKEIISKNVLAVAKYQQRHRDRIYTDIYANSIASKFVFDQNCLILKNEKKLNGFIQEISIFPFGVLFLSELQVLIWSKIFEKYPVWFFDATGSIYHDISNQKKPFLYSFTAHDKEKKIVIPITEFVTTSHNVSNISKYLLSIKTSMDFVQQQIAPIIVTDFSFALINSIMEIFNRLDLYNYLNKCYDFLINKNTKEFFSTIRSISYICSTHFLKIIIKKTKKVQATMKAKKMLVFCFSLLQNCTTIEQFDNYLVNIFNIFNCQKKDESFEYSLEILRKEMVIMNLNKNIFEENMCPNQIQRDNDFQYIVSQTKQLKSNTKASLKKLSPFDNYYENFFKELKSSIFIRNKNNNHIQNEFFYPQLFEIVSKKLYLLPLWSGLMIHNYFKTKDNKNNKVITRLTNNPVEGWFSHLKNNILQKRKVKTSEHASLIYKRVKAKYLEFYSETKNENIFEDKKQKNNKREKEVEEKWMDKNFKFKREKGFYYQNLPNFSINDDYYGFPLSDSFQSLDFDLLFDSLNSDENDKLFDLFNNIVTDNELKSFQWVKDLIIKNKDLFYNLKFLLLNSKNFESFSNQIIDQDFMKIVQLNNLENMVPVCSKKDGNCLYNSFAILYFGVEDFFYLFKLISFHVFFEHEDFFRMLFNDMSNDETFEIFIQKMSRSGEWANHFNIISLSIFLKKKIFIYSLNDSKNRTYNTKIDMWNNSDTPLAIGFLNNHFVPFMRSGYQNLEEIENDAFMRQRKIFLEFTKEQKN